MSGHTVGRSLRSDPPPGEVAQQPWVAGVRLVVALLPDDLTEAGVDRALDRLRKTALDYIEARKR